MTRMVTVTCSLCGRERQLNPWCTCPTAVERQAEVAEWERRWVAGVPVGPLPLPAADLQPEPPQERGALGRLRVR